MVPQIMATAGAFLIAFFILTLCSKQAEKAFTAIKTADTTTSFKLKDLWGIPKTFNHWDLL